jgi:pimeloyl-ACP methyl ester carboxylesterase
MTATGTSNPEIGARVDVAGIGTNYHEHGRTTDAQPPVLLLHGSGPGVSAWANWRSVLPGLSEHRRVLAPDIAGFGYTDRPHDFTYTRENWVEHLLGFLDALDLQTVSLVGNSFGGALALWLASRHPRRVDRLVLMGRMSGGALLTGLTAALPLWQHARANTARHDAVQAARAARAAMRVALSDTLDPFVHLLGRLPNAERAAKDQLRGEAISLAVSTLAGLGAAHRARVCFYLLDQERRTLRPERFAGRSGAPSAVFDPDSAEGLAALGLAGGRSWLYIPDTTSQPPPFWLDHERGYRSVLLGPVATADTVVGLITLDAPGPAELDGIDLALVRLLAALLAAALTI